MLSERLKDFSERSDFMGKVIANAPRVMDGEVKYIAITHLIPFSKHAFTLYQGERLDFFLNT